MTDELVKKNINYIYNILIEIQDYMQSIYNPNDASEAWILNNINNNINKAIRRIEVIEEILKHQKGHWIDTDNYFYRWKCSECGCYTKDAKPNFCPWCGVDTRGGHE